MKEQRRSKTGKTLEKEKKQPIIKEKGDVIMDALKCIETRASIRAYETYKMDEADIKKILKAGFEAPSAMNRRPYEFIVNTDNAFWKDYVNDKPTCLTASEASLTVLIVGDSNKNPTQEFFIEDCSAITENMLLAATALGYGSLWAGIKFGSPFYNRLIEDFSLPAGYLPIALLIFGKGKESKKQVERYEEAKIHYGRKF